MSNGTTQKSDTGAMFGFNQIPKSNESSSDEDFSTKMRDELLQAAEDGAHARKLQRKSGADSDANEAKKGEDRSHRSRSPRHRSRRSSSRHRHERRRRSRSGSRHRRRRRSGSRDRRRRSRSNPRKRSRSRSPGESQSSSSQHEKHPRKSEGERRLSTRSRSKDRSRDHRRRSHSRGRRSSSRSRRDSRRSRSRERRRRRSRSRERRRRRSGSRSKRRSRTPSPMYGFNRAMDAQERLARRLERAKELTKLKKEEEQKKANGFLGLKDDKLKEAIEKAAKMIAGSGPVSSVPHETMSAHATAQMNALRKQAEAETGISVPTYYNPLVVNPMMFAQQQAKRNLLWSKKESEEKEPVAQGQSSAVWSKTTLGDEKSDEKFAKLMGIKQTEQSKTQGPDEEIMKRQELFSNLDQQYQQARVVTHTQRGAGLGFASSNPNTLLAQQANQQLNPATSFPPKT